jgi:hypothetical protein
MTIAYHDMTLNERKISSGIFHLVSLTTAAGTAYSLAKYFDNGSRNDRIRVANYNIDKLQKMRENNPGKETMTVISKRSYEKSSSEYVTPVMEVKYTELIGVQSDIIKDARNRDSGMGSGEIVSAIIIAGIVSYAANFIASMASDRVSDFYDNTAIMLNKIFSNKKPDKNNRYRR